MQAGLTGYAHTLMILAERIRGALSRDSDLSMLLILTFIVSETICSTCVASTERMCGPGLVISSHLA